MMKRILESFPSIIQTANRWYFCSKVDVLKTYLYVIPPHRMLYIVYKKTNNLENLICSLESQLDKVPGYTVPALINSTYVKELSKYVKKHVKMIPMPALTRIMTLACKLQSYLTYKCYMRKVYLKVLRTVINNSYNLPIEELVYFVYRLVKMNRKEYTLMKEVEKVIIEYRIKINYPYVRKILWSYTHTNFGSAVLYAHISKTLLVGQHELKPLQLAESAYMLSKVSENAQGGYGVYAAAYKHLYNHLNTMSFLELVKASSYMLIQDIGSNAFQVKLEEAIYNKYPDKDKFKLNEFVMLLKATSGYFFKFKENALLSMLKTTTFRLAPFASLEQFEDIVWSWGRIGKGDKELWECLEKEIVRRVSQFKPRQLSFMYYSICSTTHSSYKLLSKLYEYFLLQDLYKINEHFLVKFLLGMQRKKQYCQDIFLKISKIISKRIQALSNSYFITFLKILNESDLDYTNKVQISSIVDSLTTIGTRLHSKIYTLRQAEISELAYLYTKFYIYDPILLYKCYFHIDNVIDIPKSAFIKAMFVFTMKEKYQKSLYFLPVLEELLKYGPIGYFFSPYEFPLLAYCLFHLKVNGNININPYLMQQAKTTMRQINPVILNYFVRKGYMEANNLMARDYFKEAP